MGCVTATAKRRRKQAKMDYKHMAPMRRPKYPRHSVEVYDRREAALRERRQTMQARKGRK